MEVIGQTENRYSGIPRIRRAMQELSLPAPVFTDSRSEFCVCLYNTINHSSAPSKGGKAFDKKGLLEFCKTPRSRAEIVSYLSISSAQYALRRYLDPLVDSGAIRLLYPDAPRSRNQRYQTAEGVASEQVRSAFGKV